MEEEEEEIHTVLETIVIESMNPEMLQMWPPEVIAARSAPLLALVERYAEVRGPQARRIDGVDRVTEVETSRRILLEATAGAAQPLSAAMLYLLTNADHFTREAAARPVAARLLAEPRAFPLGLPFIAAAAEFMGDMLPHVLPALFECLTNPAYVREAAFSLCACAEAAPAAFPAMLRRHVEDLTRLELPEDIFDALIRTRWALSADIVDDEAVELAFLQWFDGPRMRSVSHGHPARTASLTAFLDRAEQAGRDQAIDAEVRREILDALRLWRDELLRYPG